MEGPTDSLNRLYAVETLLSLTGAASDHRLRVAPSVIPRVALAFASEILKQAGLDAPALPPGVDPKWISECAKDLLANPGASLVVAGYRQPQAVHVLAQAMNAALGNLGKTVVFLEAEALEGGISELAKSLNAGEVETLVILGGNPVYAAPADLDWAQAQGRAKRVVRLSYYEDETFDAARRDGDWHLPAAHFLESWGDALTSEGVLVPVQPLIAPLFGGLTEIEVLARIAGEDVVRPYDIVRQTFGGGDDAWRKFLYEGFAEGAALKPAEVAPDPAAVKAAWTSLQSEPASSASKDSLEIVFHRDHAVDDGRYSNNGWLQEMADPVTKVAWDNAVVLSRKTARGLGLKNFDRVEIKLETAP